MIEEQEEKTNWKAWYWGLMIFLALQIGIYYLITLSFEK
jgi:hypothetical protein